MTMYEPLPNTIVIALGHKARQGKDTAAQALVEFKPRSVQRFAFADALYSYCRVVHGMTMKNAPLLQRVGVDMREDDPEVWIRALYWQMRDKQPHIAVITDLRFENEAAFVKAIGGFCIRVRRRHADGTFYTATDRDPNHVSETALDSYADWDYTIEGRDGDIEGTRAKAVDALFHCYAIAHTRIGG